MQVMTIQRSHSENGLNKKHEVYDEYSKIAS